MSKGSSNPGTSGRGGGTDDPPSHDARDDKGADNPLTHDIGDDRGVDDPLTRDIGDDKGMDDPLSRDIGDDKGMDDPLSHDVNDGKGTDNPLTHDVGDDKGGERELRLYVNEKTQQLVFSADSQELRHWELEHAMRPLDLAVSTPAAATNTVPVWRFHDAMSDVFFWTADDHLKDALIRDHPELQFEGEAFQAFRDQASGGQTAIGVVWDHDFDGAYGRFVYAPLDDAMRIGEQSADDHVDFIGVAFWV